MEITAFDLAQRWIGLKELPGAGSNPFVLGMLRLDAPGIADDETPWCSAFVSFIAWQLRLPRSKSLAARSWLTVGVPIAEQDAIIGFDVVVLSRGIKPPPASVLDAPGHVCFFAGYVGDNVGGIGGNQGNQVSLALFPRERILGIRRLV